MNSSQIQSRHSSITPYRDALSKMQAEITHLPLPDVASLLSSHERRRSSVINELIILLSQSNLLPADARTLEWCLLEHAKMFAEWIEKFKRKLFKSQAKNWLPVMLTGYVRLNRIALLSKLMRGEPSYEFIFQNLMYALDAAIKYNSIATVADAPHGDGHETVLGTLITSTLLTHTRGPHAAAVECYQLHQWLLPQATKITVTESIPKTTDATWMIDLAHGTVPVKYHAGGDISNVWFMDATSIKEAMLPLLQSPTFSSAYTRLFTPVFKKQSRAALSDFGVFNFSQLHTWLTEPHLHPTPKLTPSSLFSKHSSGCVFSFKKDEYDFAINQLWLIRPKKDEPLFIGVIRQIEDEEKSVYIHLEWIGKRPQPVEFKSEWSDVADSNRPTGWVNGLVIESISNAESVRILMPHMNTISGETIECRAPGDEKTLRSLIYNRLLALYPQHQLVDARRE